MRVYGSTGRVSVDVSTYRGRPPQRDELEQVQTYNMTEAGSEGTVIYTDGLVRVDDRPVPARFGLVRAHREPEEERWGLLVIGKDYTARVGLDGLAPDDVKLAMTADDYDTRISRRPSNITLTSIRQEPSRHRAEKARLRELAGRSPVHPDIGATRPQRFCGHGTAHVAVSGPQNAGSGKGPTMGCDQLRWASKDGRECTVSYYRSRSGRRA
jgi:hypothetical protein